MADMQRSILIADRIVSLYAHLSESDAFYQLLVDWSSFITECVEFVAYLSLVIDEFDYGLVVFCFSHCWDEVAVSSEEDGLVYGSCCA